MNVSKLKARSAVALAAAASLTAVALAAAQTASPTGDATTAGQGSPGAATNGPGTADAASAGMGTTGAATAGAGVTATVPSGVTPEEQPDRDFDPGAIVLQEGYAIEVAVTNLSLPTALHWDGGDLLVAEAGTTNVAPPRVLRIRADGTVEVVAERGLMEPVTGIATIDGQIYVSHRGRVSVVEEGVLRDVVTGLPSLGDHQNNNIVYGPDGKIYLGQGTVTNSGVVGIDNDVFGWLRAYPELREVPCEDITLVGQTFESDQPLTEESGDVARTGAYHAFGTPGTPGEVIPGDTKCNGSILRFNPDGSELEVVAWGLRNPFGLAFDKSGQLWTTFHGADVRGSRGIYGDVDYLVRVKEGAWYGWPDFFDGEPVTDDRFDPPSDPKPEMLWQDHPPLEKPFATFEAHSAANGIDIAPGGEFGYEGSAFVALFGAFMPLTTGIDVSPSGYAVARVDLSTGAVEEFARNRIPGPDYLNQSGGFDRPSDVAFGPDGALWVADWGASTVSVEGLKLVPLSGAVWRIYRVADQPAARPDGPIEVPAAAQVPESERTPLVPNIPSTYREAGGPVAILLLIVVATLAVVGLVVWGARRAAR